MGSEKRDPHGSAEELRRQAIERLNADFGTQAPEAKGVECASAEAVVQSSPDIPLSPERELSATEAIFYSSPDSQSGKARKLIWLLPVLGGVSVLLGSHYSRVIIGVVLLCTVLMVVMLASVSRRPSAGKGSMVVVDQDGIESQLFSGKIKRYPWTAVVGVSIERLHRGVRLLQLQLDATQGFQEQRDFWTGESDARPSISLASFAPAEQERLYETVRRHLLPGPDSAVVGAPLNPLAEEHRLREQLQSLAPVPGVTYGLLILNIFVWIVTVANGTGVVSASAEKLLLWGGNAASEVQRGEWWRLLTAMFLHGGVMHLIMNMIGLASVGVIVERVYGHRQFILLYFGSGLIGSALSLHFGAQQAVSVGASGAIFGIAGALLVGVYQHREQLPEAFSKQTLSSLGVFIGYSLLYGLAKQGIDNAAHIGGLLGGSVLAYVLPERFDMAHYTQNLKSRVLAGLAIAMLTIVALTATAPPAVVDQKSVLAGRAAFERAITELQGVMDMLKEEGRNIKSGKTTEQESEQRMKVAVVPRLRQIVKDFSLASLAPTDPRNPVLKDAKHLSELLLEAFEMENVQTEGSDQPEPADPARMAVIEAEIPEVLQSLQKHSQELQTKPAKR